jgi:hypothetical protein
MMLKISCACGHTGITDARLPARADVLAAMRSSSGSLAMLAAMRRASSRVRRCAAEIAGPVRPPGSQK